MLFRSVSQQITVFAQIFDGWDVLDAVLDVQTEESTLKPVQDIEITGIRVCTYKEYMESKG